jgi:OmpA-OmpF porin, OOP family
MKKAFSFIFIFLLFDLVAQHKAKVYDNGHGGKITLPLGDISFADKVISFVPGNPPPSELNSNAADALDVPDFNAEKVTGFVSLGIRGYLELSFTDNALVNIDGPDLYVFEVGRYVEETILSVSRDGKNWINVGRISGGNALVDIGDSTQPGEIFTYIRLQDAGSALKKGDKIWPGADIDAVAAIGSAKQLSLNSLYLFNTNESKIKPGAKNNLDSIVSVLKENPLYDIVIHGHTDSTGNRKFNQKLSEDRARAISNYIIARIPSLKTNIITNGFAGDRPVAENITPEGRERNRRVEVFFIPKKE